MVVIILVFVLFSYVAEEITKLLRYSNIPELRYMYIPGLDCSKETMSSGVGVATKMPE